jgi:hypothetical protein
MIANGSLHFPRLSLDDACVQRTQYFPLPGRLARFLTTYVHAVFPGSMVHLLQARGLPYTMPVEERESLVVLAVPLQSMRRMMMNSGCLADFEAVQLADVELLWAKSP